MSKITLIKIDDRIIDFTPSGVPEDFFPIDSAALIIGENGSGKTNLLRSIATNSFTKFFWTNPEQQNHQPYILYFNPIERQKLSRKTKKFQDISTIKTGNSTIHHYEIFDGAMKKVAYELVAEPARTTRKIIEIIRKYVKSNTNTPRLISSNKEDDAIRRAFFKNLNNSPQGSSIEYTERHLANLHQEFIDSAWDRMSIIEFIIFFHILNSKIDDTTAHNEILDCFGSFLITQNYPIPWEDTDIYDEWAVKTCDTKEILGRSSSVQFIGNTRIKINELVNHPMFYKIFTPCKTDGSSGEKAITRQFSNILYAISELKSRENILLLIDEGDALLHVTWQAEYINSLMNFLASLKNQYFDVVESIQVIITTHSPVVASDFPKELIISLDDTIRSKVNTFATPIDVLISSSLGDKAIGDFAASKINEACNSFKHGSSGPLEYILSITDNPIIKAGIQDMLSNSTVKPKDQE